MSNTRKLNSAGNVQVDGRWLGQPHDVLVEPTSDPKIIAQWRMYAEACHAQGAPAIVQLCHPGRQSPLGAGSKGLFEKNIAPSPVPLNLGTNFLSRMAQKLLFGSPREMTVADIEDLVQRFANAAKFLSEAGFDGVELHVAHGYLLSLFLSPTVSPNSTLIKASALISYRSTNVQMLTAGPRSTAPASSSISSRLHAPSSLQHSPSVSS